MDPEVRQGFQKRYTHLRSGETSSDGFRGSATQRIRRNMKEKMVCGMSIQLLLLLVGRNFMPIMTRLGEEDQSIQRKVDHAQSMHRRKCLQHPSALSVPSNGSEAFNAVAANAHGLGVEKPGRGLDTIQASSRVQTEESAEENGGPPCNSTPPSDSARTGRLLTTCIERPALPCVLFTCA